MEQQQEQQISVQPSHKTDCLKKLGAEKHGYLERLTCLILIAFLSWVSFYVGNLRKFIGKGIPGWSYLDIGAVVQLF